MTEKTAAPALHEELDRLSDAAAEKVDHWLTLTQQSGVKPHASAQLLSAVLSHPTGLDFTVGFVDRVIRTEDTKAAAKALSELGELAPETMNKLDLAQIQAGSKLGRLLPNVVVPAARQRMRSMVGHMVIDARDKQFGKAVSQITKQGNGLNINLLGEAVLGETEADRHLEDTVRLLRRDDVDYVSIKVSSIASQISMWGFDETVDYVVQRLVPLYTETAEQPAGTKFINLDMEEYADLRLTIEVFKRLLSMPQLKHYEAGIVIQAYLPDALGAVQELTEFANARVDDGGAGIKIRLVKGANLPMEHVHAEIRGWDQATCESKEATDANYKRVLHWLLTQDRMKGVRLGVAGHNLFDLAFAHLLGAERGVSENLDFEMLQGMAAEQQGPISDDVGQLLLYVPAVRPEEFDVAISYLVRRLEENASSENFMSGIFELEPGNEIFVREENRFRSSVDTLEETIEEHGETPPGPNHTQNRAAEEVAQPTDYTDAELPAFANEPDTDPTLAANQQWGREAIARATPDWLTQQALPEQISSDAVEPLIETARSAAEEWAARPAAERARILYAAADLMASRRGHLLSVAAAEPGKSPQQSDPEISEAIDFARYYAHSALTMEQIDDAAFTADKLVLITPPWNFPIAIPAGGTFAALAAGAAVIHKPSRPTPHCSMAILEALWDAGVPREVLHGVYPDEREAGRLLVSHDGVDRVILTGASETAAMFRSWKPELKLNAETSGKNALVVTPAADRDLAVADLVNSAFGHAGQKCSAASLGILIGSVYRSDRFRRQLIDAASSLVVDWPSNLSATVGPLTEEPSEKLHRALTTLDEGETWLLEPKPLDDTGKLWRPGIKTGVKPGSFFHMTEVFGPVLGLMDAKDLDEAIALQNQVEYGLTGGIHSLEIDEVQQWLDQVAVGNAYVNRGITGAIVQRQSFGGWKKSSVGLGSKAGGPNYVMLFGTWHDDVDIAAAAQSRPPQEDTPQRRLIDAALDKSLISDEDYAWLKSAASSDRRWWDEEFGQAVDHTGLDAEANIFRYLPEHVLLRVSDDAQPGEVIRAALAAQQASTTFDLSWNPDAAKKTVKAAKLIGQLAKRTGKHDDAEFAKKLSTAEFVQDGSARIRVIGTASSEQFAAAAPLPEIALLDDPVTASGRVELRYWLKEQAVSMTLHRFGTPASSFHKLADQLKG